MQSKFIRNTLVSGAVLLSACGGNDTPNTAANGATMLLSSISSTNDNAGSTTLVRQGAAASTAVALPSLNQAAHFLHQASFGPRYGGISYVSQIGEEAWLNEQLGVAQDSIRYAMNAYASTLAASGTAISTNDFNALFWKTVVNAPDQLRQRLIYALSQIFVISTVDDGIWAHPYGVASYYDTLARYAFGNFRDLLEGVALHPMMGIYLSHMHNQKENDTRVPDENFAREIMQLMSIGLYQLNQDGTQKLVNGKPVETYTHDDVAGLAKVFTGWSWAGPDQSSSRFVGLSADSQRDWTPMQNYSAYHSTSEKHFLGVSIGSGTTGAYDLKVALDTLFNHPNVGPFIGKQLIQRLVTSNPSPAYVGRVAAAFANNGAGVRGDMKAVIRAILLDPEAKDMSTSKKVKEPVLRLANWMRAFNANSSNGTFAVGPLEDPTYGLGQSPMRAPSVFNFYRPSYTPPNSGLAQTQQVAPELQITSEPSVTGYLNYMQSAIPWGTGTNGNIKPDYTSEIALAATPDKLVDRVSLLLMSGTMSSTLRSRIIASLQSIPQPVPTSSNADKVAEFKKYRVYLAVYLTMASSEYLVQQ